MKNLLTATFIGTCLIGSTAFGMEIKAQSIDASVLISNKPDLGRRGYDLQTAELTFINVPTHLQNKSPEELRLLAAQSLLAMNYNDGQIKLDMSKNASLQTPPTSTLRKILVNGLFLAAGAGAGYLIATKTNAGE